MPQRFRSGAINFEISTEPENAVCSVTWFMGANEYDVFFNRDELKTRSRALPPSIKVQNGVRYATPLDVDGGGTWLGVNEFGLTCGLLNNYVRSRPVRDATVPKGTTNYRSRGLLAAFLLDCSSQSDALLKLTATDMNVYKPFLLTLFAPNNPVALAVWDGESLRIQNEKVKMPISSSSFDTQNVVQHRQQEFAKLQAHRRRIDASFLESYHSSHSSKGGAYSVCMHREDAETVSFSRIRVTSDDVEFRYTPGAPCKAAESKIVCRSRRRLKNDF